MTVPLAYGSGIGHAGSPGDVAVPAQGGLSAQVWLSALGVRVTVDVADPAVRDVVVELFADLAPQQAVGSSPRLTQVADGPTVSIAVTGHGPWLVESPEHTQSCPSRPELVSALLSAVNLSVVAATPWLSLHAALVSYQGAVVAIPAASGVGKSTLTAALVRTGWTYHSDEAVSFDWGTGEVLGYPRPVALSQWSCRAVGVHGMAAVGEFGCVVSEFGTVDSGVPGPITAVVIPQRGDALALRELPAQQIVAAFLENGFTHHRDPAAALRRFADVARRARCYALTLADPMATAALLHERLAGSSRRSAR